jgi:NAD(P)-dependent dehydrogenase (short-subunit alcohol dehydrogenase family)
MMQGKVVVITGAARGFGRAIAERMGSDGCRIVAWDVAPDAEQPAAHVERMDVSDPESVETATRNTFAAMGRIDVLVNNAMSHTVPWGGAQGPGLLNTSDDDWDVMMAVGVKSPFIACQEAIPHMVRQGGGSIINISSIRGLVAMRNGGAYDVAKAGILNLSRQVTVDFAQHGIRANTISPGWIQSDETHRQFEEDPASLGGALIPQPVRRPGRYVDIAYAALFLASDESTFVSGANLIVDGGLLAQTGFDIRQATLEAERQSSG